MFAIIGGFLVSALGGSRFQIGGPAGAFIVLVASVIERHGFVRDAEQAAIDRVETVGDIRKQQRRTVLQQRGEGVRQHPDFLFPQMQAGDVKELPIIRDIQFEGLKSVSESDVLKTFRERRVGWHRWSD